MSTATAAWLQPVKLWPAGSERRVTWLELFFDVIFVAAVAQVGHPLSEDYSPTGLLRYTFLFLMIWWAWLGHTAYCTRFHSEDRVQRLLTFLQFFAVAIMAANAKSGLDSEDSAGFGAAYAVMRGVLVAQYVRARRIPSTRGLATWHAAGFGTAAALWLTGSLLPAPWRFGLWALALVIDFSTPWMAGHHTHKVPADAAHFPERFGLFTLILLGESVAAIMRGIESQPTWSPLAVTAAFSSLGLMCAFWWGYFYGANAAGERHLRSRRDRTLLQVWMHSHIFFYLAIAVLAVGLEHVIARGNQALHGSELGILGAAFVIATGSLLVIARASHPAEPRQTP